MQTPIAWIFCLLSLWIGAASPATASTLDITYTGIITSGSTDLTGIFGKTDTSGQAYLGMGFLANVYVDSSLGTTSGTITSNSILYATVAINGNTQFITPTNTNQVNSFNNGAVMAINPSIHSVVSDAKGAPILINNLSLIAYANAIDSVPIDPKLGQNPGFDSSFAGSGGSGSFQLFALLRPDDLSTVFLTNTQIFTSFESVRVTDLTPVASTPLPAALPFFVAGLGAMGYIRWRRKRLALDVDRA